MSREKQIAEIKELAIDILEEFTNCYSEVDEEVLAKMIYDAGYRKQIEAEWESGKKNGQYGYYCTNCEAGFTGDNAEWIAKSHKFCPECGAEMKGERK